MSRVLAAVRVVIGRSASQATCNTVAWRWRCASGVGRRRRSRGAQLFDAIQAKTRVANGYRRVDCAAAAAAAATTRMPDRRFFIAERRATHSGVRDVMASNAELVRGRVATAAAAAG